MPTTPSYPLSSIPPSIPPPQPFRRAPSHLSHLLWLEVSLFAPPLFSSSSIIYCLLTPLFALISVTSPFPSAKPVCASQRFPFFPYFWPKLTRHPQQFLRLHSIGSLSLGYLFIY
ncbi:hypothetical protein AMTR_s00110p00109440 [Amborella trichopoda]|uniref:Uncharacterized protein n=1 Tax=Amborella trichopoda TaxID=13333 RepID=W1NZ22_AMBTC|nr:hypothetical protein AMTR_s00110p00109440 [Amborella trichopoda]